MKAISSKGNFETKFRKKTVHPVQKEEAGVVRQFNTANSSEYYVLG